MHPNGILLNTGQVAIVPVALSMTVLCYHLGTTRPVCMVGAEMKTSHDLTQLKDKSTGTICYLSCVKGSAQSSLY